MARYIDANVLKLSIIGWLAEAERNHQESIIKALHICEYLVDGTPTADVEEVRHGEWLEGNRWQLCSKCHKRGKRSWKYCPKCGAHMR